MRMHKGIAGSAQWLLSPLRCPPACVTRSSFINLRVIFITGNQHFPSHSHFLLGRFSPALYANCYQCIFYQESRVLIKMSDGVVPYLGPASFLTPLLYCHQLALVYLTQPPFPYWLLSNYETYPVLRCHLSVLFLAYFWGSFCEHGQSCFGSQYMYFIFWFWFICTVSCISQFWCFFKRRLVWHREVSVAWCSLLPCAFLRI